MAEFEVLRGGNFKRRYLEEIMSIDARVYEPRYVGELKNMQARYDAENNSFVAIRTEGAIVGYINFFPVTDSLWDDITKDGTVIRDDDIRPDEIRPYTTAAGNRLFIISVVILEEYRCRESVVALTDGFIDCLNELEEGGYKIEAIAGTAVSPDGKKFMTQRRFYERREVGDLPGGEGNDTVFVCEGGMLRNFMGGKWYYKKRYQDDLYMVVPFADNPIFSKTEEIKARCEGQEIPEEACFLIDAFNDCLEYECNPSVVAGIENIYLGSCDFLFAYDEKTCDGKPAFYAREKAYLVLMADGANHMYNLLLFVPGSACSPSDCGDILSRREIYIANPEGDIAEDCEKILKDKEFFPYIDLLELMNRRYGFINCGPAKLMAVTSARPEDAELACILAGESYISARQDFRLRPEIILPSENSVYDYYESYMSDRTIVCVMEDFPGDLEERVGLVATYAFIVEIVTFQHTALEKITQKVGAAITRHGEVSYRYIKGLYRDYAGMEKYGQGNVFKYMGTQKEADNIREAFGSDETLEEYNRQQEFLENYIEINDAERSKITSTVINVAAIFLAILGISDYVSGLISEAADTMGVPIVNAGDFFTRLIFAGILMYIIIEIIVARKNAHEREQNMIEEYRRKFDFLKEDDECRKPD